MQTNGGSTTGQGGAAGTWRLKASQDHHVAVVAHIIGQVMQNTAAGGHAAGCQNDHGAMPLDQGFGLFWRFNHGGHMVHGLNFLRTQAVFTHVPFKEGRGVNRHGAVQKYGQAVRNFAAVFELCNAVQNGLRSAHRKHWHHSNAATGRNFFQGGAQFGIDVFKGVNAIALGGLNENGIGLWRCVWRVHQAVVGATQIAREQNAFARHFQQQTAGTQDVAGGAELGIPALDRLKPFVEFFDMKLLHAVLGILLGVKRQCGAVFRETMAIGKVGVFFLNVTTVGQQNGAQISRA